MNLKLIFHLLFFILLPHFVMPKKVKMKSKHDQGVSLESLEGAEEEGTCNATLTSENSCNVTDVIGFSIANASQLGVKDKSAIGIDLEKLAKNLSEFRRILVNDTVLDSLFVTTDEEDRLSHPGSFIIPYLDRYDNLTAPTFFADIPVEVTISVYINSLSGIDTTRMEYVIDIDLIMQWRDFRLIHKFSPYILIKESSIMEQLWRPDPYFINEKDAHLFDVTFPNVQMKVFPGGEIVYIMRLILTVACPMEFCRYPHDTQRCDLRIGSIAYPTDLITFDWVNDSAVLMNPQNRIPLFDLTSLETGTCNNAGRVVDSSCLRLAFSLKRNIQSHLLRKYIPSVYAMVFSWSALFAPFHFGEVRIVNPVLVLLTLKQLQRSDEALPSVSYVTALDIWFSIVQAFVILSLIEAVFYYALMKRRNIFKKMAQEPGLDSAEAEKLIERSRLFKKRANQMDDASKILFPALFIIFILLYIFVISNPDLNNCAN